MSSWDTISIKFSPFESLKGPLESVLTLLETVEAILETFLDIVKVFLIDFGNPLKAIFSLLLAAVRALINQIKSLGFSVLVVHPDFSRQDFGAVLQSVAGAYPSFEKKVISKFYDTSDVFRPQYPSGSSVAMIIFYIGVESPGDLLLQLFALMRLLKTPVILSGLPAPIDVKVNPIKKSGEPISQFKELFGSDLSKSLAVEWQMPTTPNRSPLPGFMNSMVSFYNSFRFPNFIVERSEKPQGSEVTVEVKNSPTMGKSITNTVKRYNLAATTTSLPVIEENGDIFRNFEKKISVTGSKLLEGRFTSTYRYIDNDPSLEPGKAYYYRIRAYFGNPLKYLGTTDSASVINNGSLLVTEGNQPIIRYDSNSTVGPPSPIARGFVPRIQPTSINFNPYDAIYNAVKAGILLNFEMPAVSGSLSHSLTEQNQRAGWGVLSAAAGQITLIKSSLKKSNLLLNSLTFKSTCRRISNQTLTNLYSQPRLMDLIVNKWNNGIEEIVSTVIDSEIAWSFPSITSGYTSDNEKIIDSYLSEETNYKNGQHNLNGPYPTSDFKLKGEPINLTSDDRKKLADFLTTCLSSLSGSTTYLSWYSITIGDMFPSFTPFMFDFEQWLLSMVKALQTAVTAIEDMIQTIITKIQQLEQIIASISALIELFNVSVNVSILGVSSSNGSANSLAQYLLESDNKPAGSPFVLHSGIVCTFGGPGEGFIAAFKALKFILGL